MKLLLKLTIPTAGAEVLHMEAAADLMPEGSEERGDLPEAEQLWN